MSATPLDRLEPGRVVTVSEASWNDYASAFEVLERHPTFGPGDLLLVPTPAGLVEKGR